MEASDFQTKDSAFYVAYTKARSWISTFLGIILTILGIGVVFVVSSLEGTKEIQAPSAVSAAILNTWRENNEGQYPEQRAEIIQYDGREYYFVITFDDPITDEIDQWHFAYDGGLDYVFSDYKFYVLTAITSVVSIYVAYVNYITTTRSVMGTEAFSKTLKHYQEKKQKIEKYTQYIPEFCMYKNKQAYENAKRDIIEEAAINYDLYKQHEFDYAYLSKLAPWQKKILSKVQKIRVRKIYSADLLQEHNTGGMELKIDLLPQSQKQHQRSFVWGGMLTRILTSALSGLTVAFGIVLGNWVLGVTYGISVFISYVSAVVIATDFVSTTLRNRFLAKADLLNEFDNIKDKFVVVEKSV
jgi:Na+-transporting methylmalonyl-CoA/oxaloacetate decarboxylase gamma subunit